MTLARCVLALLVTAVPVAAEMPTPDQLVGSYVGRATEMVTDGAPTELRDIDIEISPYREGGLKVAWVNVTLVDGRRDVPGVERRTDAVLLVPAGEGRSFYLAGTGYDPFAEKKELDVLAGDPVRWAYLDQHGLRVQSFQILPDGSYELQTYTRTPTDVGLDLAFERVVDGAVTRRMTGKTVRAD